MTSIVLSAVNNLMASNSYVKEHTHLAYASTEFGVQGATVQAGHGIVTDASSASAVYVSATRGRQSNTLHLVAETPLQARELFVDAMTREVGDRGVEKKRGAALRDLEGTVGTRGRTESERSQAAWWGVDVDRPEPRRPQVRTDKAAQSTTPTRETTNARETTKARAGEPVRHPDVAARAARDAEATRIARDAAKARQITHGREL